MKKCFVASMRNDLREAMAGFNRLYAFPMPPDKPDEGGFVMMDSGAYGLSQRHREIDAEHMFRLARYYKANGGSNQMPVLAVAPDVFLDPVKSKNNYRFWMQYIGQPVVPVIQFTKKKQVDIAVALRQVDFYLPGNRVMCISNPGLRAKEAGAMQFIIEYMRKVGVEWIHNLGAGWNTLDCRDWFDLGFDSIDSIAYYTDADRGVAWRPSSYTTGHSNSTNIEIALNNIQLANYYAR